ncbi:MAG TPA: HAMP domain-containing sensor histidine kinase [Polyangiaceae bacterium]|jgi:two-component system sensor histidine kinase TctE
MRLDGALLAIVTEGAPWAHRVADSLRNHGADVRVCAPDRDLWFVLTSEPFDAVALADVHARRGLLRALAEEPRTQKLPTVLLRARGAPLSVPPPGEEGRAPAALGVAEAEGADLERVLSETIAAGRRRPPSPPPPAPRARNATVVHDVRVLLGLVVGFAANLRDGVAGPVTAQQRGHAQKIGAAAHDASALLEQLLEGGEGSDVPPRAPQRAQVDLAGLAFAVVALFEGHAGERGVAVVQGPLPARPVHVWGDPLQLKQVATNLLVNAIKFTPQGGTVTVSVRLAEGAEADGPMARRVAELVVSDTGPGVPAEEREHVFERGVRLARDSGIPGTGIGLSVVRDLVHRHGGTVTVGQAASGGAEFVVRLPLDLRVRPREAPPRGAP